MIDTNMTIAKRLSSEFAWTSRLWLIRPLRPKAISIVSGIIQDGMSCSPLSQWLDGTSGLDLSFGTRGTRDHTEIWCTGSDLATTLFCLRIRVARRSPKQEEMSLTFLSRPTICILPENPLSCMLICSGDRPTQVIELEISCAALDQSSQQRINFDWLLTDGNSLPSIMRWPSTVCAISRTLEEGGKWKTLPHWAQSQPDEMYLAKSRETGQWSVCHADMDVALPFHSLKMEDGLVFDSYLYDSNMLVGDFPRGFR